MRIKRLVSAGVLAAMVTMSLGTVAQAYNDNSYQQSLGFDDFSGPQNTDYHYKDTSTSIFISYDWGTSQGDNRIRFGTMGAYDNNGNGANDVSNNHYYIMYPGESRGDIYNWVNEWGYSNAAIQASTMGDSAVSMVMTWRLDN